APLAIEYLASYYFLGLNITASIMVASMFATHTLVAYPIASRLGLTRNEAVTIAVGGTIITDTAVLLVLAVITGSTQGEIDLEFWLRLATSLSILNLIVFCGFPKIGRWFFKHIVGENTSQYIS